MNKPGYGKVAYPGTETGMADGLRCGIGLLLCLAWAGCRTPEFYNPALVEAKPPPLTVIRPDPPAPTPPVRTSTLNTRILPPTDTANIIPASVPPQPATDPATSSVPQVLPEMGTPPQARRSDLDTIRSLVQEAQNRLDGMESYCVRFRRREVIHGRQMPEDLLSCRFRQRPFSVYMKSIGSNAEGRELIWVEGKYQNLLQVKTGKGDVIAGICLELDPHSPRATANSRRTIEESGLGNLVQRITGVLQRIEAGQTQETMTYLGPQQRPESRQPMTAIVQKILPGQEKLLPQGGKRYFFFNNDPQSAECHLPVLVITEDATGHEVEYYHYDRLSPNIGLTERDFDPAFLWGKK